MISLHDPLFKSPLITSSDLINPQSSHHSLHLMIVIPPTGSGGGGGGGSNKQSTPINSPSRPLLRLRTLFFFSSKDPHPFMSPVFSSTWATSTLSPYTREFYLPPSAAMINTSYMELDNAGDPPGCTH